MGVRAAETECADAGRPRALADSPGHLFGRHLNGHVFPGNVRARVIEMQMSWNLLMLKGQNHFDQAGNARRGFEMTEVRLD